MATTPQLSDNALRILKARYLLAGESPTGLFHRVADAVASVEEEGRAAWAERFYEMMASGRFMPNSPTLFNAGTGQGTLSACFVIPIEDTMESIMAAATTTAMVQKYGGGTGYSFGRLRGRGSHISTTHGEACGAIAVLEMLSNVSDMITQGGKRHGANMGILPVSHPEILQFIHLKDDNATAQNFNVSVAITDAFMEAVERDSPWPLIQPHTGEVAETVEARELWRQIVDSAWRTGDPGIYFIDQANRRNPTPHLGELESTNPCGEVPLLPNEACNLGSVNLAAFVGDGRIDTGALEATVRTAARFLDDVVSANGFPVDAVAQAVATTRKVGLGVMGWHDALIRLDIPYASDRALTLAHDVMGRINEAAAEVSAELAHARGAYPASRDRRYRNATRTCIAPTGTISAIAGCSSGIEPLFALAFVKNVLDGQRLSEINPHFERVARQRGFWSEELMREVVRTGSVQHIHDVPDDVKALFATAMEIPYEAHVRMQAAFQAHTDLAVSKTINMPSDATRDDVERAYALAYSLGCTGITVYRDGSKPTQVLETGERAAAPSAELAKRERPKTIMGVTERVRTAHGNAYVTVNFDASGQPFEVFTAIGKAGSADQAYLEAISRLISLSLRSGVSVTEIINQLRGITSDPVWDGGQLVTSAPDAVARVLAMHALGAGETDGEQRLMRAYAAQTALPMDVGARPEMLAGQGRCPLCNGALVRREGCVACPSCGWDRCE